MNRVPIAAAVLPLMLALLLADVYAAAPAEVSEQESAISLRAGRHPQFYRIVLEGADDIIAKGRVRQREKDIRISFDDARIHVEQKSTPFEYKKDDDGIVVSLPKKGDMKVFSLKEPSRLVVDVYPPKGQKRRPAAKKQGDAEDRNKDVRKTAANSVKGTADRAPVAAAQRTPSDDRAIVLADAHSEQGMENASPLGSRTPGDDRSVVPQGTGSEQAGGSSGASQARTPEDDRSIPLAERKMAKIAGRKDKRAESYPAGGNDEEQGGQYEGIEEIIVPEKFETMWQLLQSGNAIGNLMKLPQITPEGTEEMAFSYYLYGEGYNAAGEYIKAIDNLRLAYIYSGDSALRELALFRRAKVYEAMGLHHEARSNYLVFIDEFPESKRIQKTYRGLADSSQKLGLLNEAVQYYDRAGSDAVALFHKANALQKLEKVKEAKEVYELAMKADRGYPKKSFETYYLIGENMRLNGELKKAKEHFNNIQYGPFLDSAKISLGLIAMDEANIKEAGRNFLLASESKDRNIRVRALFSLAFALLSVGQTQEAIEALEEIRFKYLDTDLYKDALLALARLYHKEGKTREAVSVLKELAYGKRPPAGTFLELETIVQDLSEKDSVKVGDEMNFLEIWNEMGKWLLEESREEFLLRMAKRLRYEGEPFIKLSVWLIEHGSSKARVKASVGLADYFISIGKIGMAEAYMTRAVDIEKPDDEALRVKAKILRAKSEYMNAVRTVESIKNFGKEDLMFTGTVLLDMDNAKSAQTDKVIAFYESRLNSGEWDADHYVRIADILYKNNEKGKALEYYRKAYALNPDDEWISYRIGRAESGTESKELYSKLDKGGSMLGRLAKSKLMEINLLNKVREVY